MKKGVFLIILIFILLINVSYADVPDDDQDGVPDEDDQCPASSSDVVDQYGCDCDQKDCPSDDNDCTDDCSDVNSLAACGWVNNDNPCSDGYCSGGTCVVCGRLSEPCCTSTQATQCSGNLICSPDGTCQRPDPVLGSCTDSDGGLEYINGACLPPTGGGCDSTNCPISSGRTCQVSASSPSTCKCEAAACTAVGAGYTCNNDGLTCDPPRGACDSTNCPISTGRTCQGSPSTCKCEAAACTAVLDGSTCSPNGLTCQPPSHVRAGSCTETDGGKKYSKAGTTTEEGTVSVVSADTCNNNILTEYFCDGDSADSETYTCPNGCRDGRCLRVTEEVKCIFSGSEDTQKCYSNKGTCEGKNQCVVTVRGKAEDTIVWGSSCGGSASTTIDGDNEHARFDCSVEANTCEETDNGKDYLTYGKCTGKNGRVKKDRCAWLLGVPGIYHSYKLIEFSCNNQGGCQRTKINCREEYDKSYGCVKGACVETSCTDSDNGLNYKVYGKVTNQKGKVKKDRCTRQLGMFKTNKLIEYSCQDDGTFMNVKIDCEEEYGENYGCVKGACVEIEDSCTDTDEEDDPLTYGECMGKNGKIKEDKCGRFLGALRTKKLIQYSCNQNENCRKTEIDCKEDYGPGFICSRGECVES